MESDTPTLTRLFVDLATRRVVYFTADLNSQMPTSEHFVLVEYSKPVPSNMNLTNCWKFVYKDQSLQELLAETKPALSAVESNKQTCRIKLQQAIDQNTHVKDMLELIVLKHVCAQPQSEMFSQLNLLLTNSDHTLANTLDDRILTIQSKLTQLYITRLKISHLIDQAQTGDDFLQIHNHIDQLHNMS